MPKLPRGDGDTRTTGDRSPIHRDVATRDVDRQVQAPSLFDDGFKELGKELMGFVDSPDGYLKLRRSDGDSDLHLTWTWTLGSHARSYVYVRVNYWEVSVGLGLLRKKKQLVDLGQMRPSPDRYSGG